MGESSSNQNQTQHLNEPKQKVMIHVWLCREDPHLPLPVHLRRAEQPPLSFYFKMVLEQIVAEKSLNPCGEQGWALPSQAAVPAAAWGMLYSLHWLSVSWIDTYLFSDLLGHWDVVSASQKV